MSRVRQSVIGRRFALLLVAALFGVALAQTAVSPVAAGFGPVLNVYVRGAGTVTEITDARRINCASSATTPTGTLAAYCFEEYGGGWIVELRATPSPGYEFAGWLGVTDAPVHCDGANERHFLAAGTCKFQIWQSLGIEARFADTTPPDTSIDDGPPELTNDATATFDFSSNQAGSTF